MHILVDSDRKKTAHYVEGSHRGRATAKNFPTYSLINNKISIDSISTFIVRLFYYWSFYG